MVERLVPLPCSSRILWLRPCCGGKIRIDVLRLAGFAAASVSGSARFLSFANAEDFDVLRFESIERHVLVPEFLPRFFVDWLAASAATAVTAMDRGKVISESEFVIHLNNRTLVYV